MIAKQHSLHFLNTRKYLLTVFSDLKKITIQNWVLSIAIIIFLFTTIVLSYLRYITYQTNAWDLGIFMQAMWTTGHEGKLFYYTSELPWNPSGSLFGVHFSPILFLLVPIYYFLPGALTLLIIQSIVVAASVIPLYKLMLLRVNQNIAILLSICYLFSPPLLGAIFYDFHIESFIPLTALSLWLAIETKRFKLATISSLALISVIEFGTIIMSAIGFMFVIKEIIRYYKIREKRLIKNEIIFPLTITFVGILLTFFVFAVPKIVEPSTPPYVQVGILGGSITEIFTNILMNPIIILNALSVNFTDKLLFLFAIWLSGLSIWLIKPLDAFPAYAWLGVAMLTATPSYIMPNGNQYTFMIIPFLFPATASALALIHSKVTLVSNKEINLNITTIKFKQITNFILLGSIICLPLLISQIYYNPISPISNSWLSVTKLPSNHDDSINKVIALIPRNASVSAMPELLPQVANRINAYPYIIKDVSYIIVDTSSYWISTDLPPPMSNPPWLLELSNLDYSSYGVLAQDDGVILLKKGYKNEPLISNLSNFSIPPTRFNIVSGTIIYDSNSPMGSYLALPYHNVTSFDWFGPYVILPPGTYKLGVWLHSNQSSNGYLELHANNGLNGNILQLQFWNIHTNSLGDGWKQIWLTVEIPYSGFFELTGYSSTTGNLEFGGLIINQMSVRINTINNQS